MDPSPDYDASDEIEFFFSYLPWGLRGVDRRQRLPAAGIPAGLACSPYSALSSSATSVTDFFASPNSIVVPSA